MLESKYIIVQSHPAIDGGAAQAIPVSYQGPTMIDEYAKAIAGPVLFMCSQDLERPGPEVIARRIWAIASCMVDARQAVMLERAQALNAAAEAHNAVQAAAQASSDRKDATKP